MHTNAAMATRGGAGRGSAAQRRQTHQHGPDNAKLDEVAERVTKLEASVASLYSKEDIKDLVKELMEREAAKLRMEFQHQMTNHSTAAGSQITELTGGYKNADELKGDKRLPFLIHG